MNSWENIPVLLVRGGWPAQVLPADHVHAPVDLRSGTCRKGWVWGCSSSETEFLVRWDSSVPVFPFDTVIATFSRK